MPRVRLVLAVAGCALAIGSGTAVAGTAAPPRSQLLSFVCQKAPDPEARGVSVQAVMRPLDGTSKMQMRFEVMRQIRTGAPFRPVRGRLLDRWMSPPDATLGQRAGDVWIVNRPVVDLSGPATYRFRVTFRWTAATGQPLGTEVQTSPNCYEPELRPDLLVRSLTVTPLASGQDAYTAVIANRGATGAGPVEVELDGAASLVQTATLAWLGPRSSTSQRWVAPQCTAGASLVVKVDPSHSIDEYDPANNTLMVPCPAPAAGSG
jgi:hypothetical protein